MRQVLGTRTTKWLGIILIFAGALMVILQIACTAITEKMDRYFAHRAGTGIWCGLLILMSGVVGCCAAVKKNNALVSYTIIYTYLPREPSCKGSEFWEARACNIYMILHIYI